MSIAPLRPTLPLLLLASAGLLVAATAVPASPADKFTGANVDCEQFFLWKRTPVLHYDIGDERRADYEAGPAPEYFRQAAERMAAYCDRTSARPQQPLRPPRRIRGVWFQSTDGQFKALYDLDAGSIDASAGIVNQIGDRHQAKVRAEARQAAHLEGIRTRDAREKELQAAREQAARDKAAADLKEAQERQAAVDARIAAFMAVPKLQRERLGTEVKLEHFATLEAVRTNPFHFQAIGLAVVRARFNRMMSKDVALFGNELQPLYVRIDDVDRFTRGGETVMLAMRVLKREELKPSFDSVPEIVLSMMKAEPLGAAYVGAYTCPGDDCMQLFDVPPPS